MSVSLWLTVWEWPDPVGRLKERTASVHATRAEAEDEIVEALRDGWAHRLVSTVEVAPDGAVARVDLMPAAREAIRDIAAANRAQEIEGRMLRFRQAGV
jgi:hypothetical protein